MNNKIYLKFFLALFVLLGFLKSNAVDVIFSTAMGEVLVLDVEKSETIEEIQTAVELYLEMPEVDRVDNKMFLLLHEEQEVTCEDLIAAVFPRKRKYATSNVKEEQSGITRVYQDELKKHEMDDIRYIVTTLADKSTAKLLFYKGSLESAGERVNHVHPLNFLAFIFSDKVLKIKVKNIRGKDWVWSDFMGGLSKSLQDEKNKGNLTPENVEDFARVVDIDVEKIEPSISSDRWDTLVTILIANVKKNDDYDRYGM